MIIKLEDIPKKVPKQYVVDLIKSCETHRQIDFIIDNTFIKNKTTKRETLAPDYYCIDDELYVLILLKKVELQLKGIDM